MADPDRNPHATFPPDLWPLLILYVDSPRVLLNLSQLDSSWHDFITSGNPGQPAPRKWAALAAKRWRHAAEGHTRETDSDLRASPELQAYRRRHIIDTDARREIEACSVAPVVERHHRIADFGARFGLDAFDYLLAAIERTYGHMEMQTLRETAETALGTIRREWVVDCWRRVRRQSREPSLEGVPRVPVELGSSLFSLFAFPHVDYKRDVEEKLDALANEIKREAAVEKAAMAGEDDEVAGNPLDPFPRWMSKREKAAKISSHLASAGYKGNDRAYYSVANSLMNQVLQTKAGIPITLGLIFKAVAERCGMAVEMISTPGHMLTRLAVEHPDEEKLYIDMFQAGVVLDEPQVQAMFAGPLFGFNLEDHLRAASDQETFLRMARNILNAVQNRDSLSSPNANFVLVSALWCFALLSSSLNLQIRFQLYRHVETVMPCDGRLLEADLAELERENVDSELLKPLRIIVERMREDVDMDD